MGIFLDCEDTQLSLELTGNVPPHRFTYRPFTNVHNLEIPVQYDPARDTSFVAYVPDISPAKSFSFLKHFTTRHGLTGCIWAKFVAKVADATTNPPNTLIDGSPPMESPNSAGPHDLIKAETTTEAHQDAFIPNKLVEPSQLIPHAMNSPSYKKTWEIYLIIQRSLKRDPNLIDQRCLDFFSPIAISASLELYWPIFHPNWPVMHKPSFRLETTPPMLLAILVMAGSSIFNRNETNYWALIIEPIVFQDLQLSLKVTNVWHKVQCIQAAYLLCCHLNWEGSSKDRSRAIMRLFPLVLAAAMDMNMSVYRHDKLASTFEEFNYSAFIRKEETIRTLMWVFLLDTGFVVFNNVSPRFSVEDSVMGLVIPEIAYQTDSPRECFSLLQSWQATNGRPHDLSVFGLVKMFFRPDLNKATINSLAHESFLNLWAVISALHSILYRLNPKTDESTQFESFRVALDNWETVWKTRLQNNDENYFDVIVATAVLNPGTENRDRSWKDAGFWGNAGEYWLLARTILDHMVTARESSLATAEEIGVVQEISPDNEPVVSNEDEAAGMDSLHSLLTVLEAAG